MSVKTIDLTIATTELASGESEYGPWKLIGVLDGDGDAVASTLKKAIQKKLKGLEGQPATVVYKTDEEGRNTIISVEQTDSAPPAPEARASTNGDTPTGEATPAAASPSPTQKATAPQDAVRMARGAAWKSVTNEGFVKAAMAVYSAEQPGDQLTSQKLHDLLAKHALKISNNILGDEAIPFN